MYWEQILKRKQLWIPLTNYHFFIGGQLEFLRLLKENLALFMDHIPLVELSKTFCDAIEIARNLGFSWLWIDSLCIIQDSRDDWHKESLAMDRVYLNGVLNLAATGYRNGQEGLLRFTEPREIMPPKIDCAKFNSHSPKYSVFSSFDWTREVTRAPLNERGWVCQEQVMASFFFLCFSHSSNCRQFWLYILIIRSLQERYILVEGKCTGNVMPQAVASRFPQVPHSSTHHPSKCG